MGRVLLSELLWHQDEPFHLCPWCFFFQPQLSAGPAGGRVVGTRGVANALLSVGQKNLLTVPAERSGWKNLGFCCESVVSPRKEKSRIVPGETRLTLWCLHPKSTGSFSCLYPASSNRDEPPRLQPCSSAAAFPDTLCTSLPASLELITGAKEQRREAARSRSFCFASLGAQKKPDGTTGG